MTFLRKEYAIYEEMYIIIFMLIDAGGNTGGL